MKNLLFLIGALILFTSCSDAKIKQPNFLFILVDDQPFDAFGYNRRYPFLETPNMDKLRSKGINVELYNLKEDIGETKNLSSKYPEQTADLLAELKEWLVETNAQMPRNIEDINDDELFGKR